MLPCNLSGPSWTGCSLTHQVIKQDIIAANHYQKEIVYTWSDPCSSWRLHITKKLYEEIAQMPMVFTPLTVLSTANHSVMMYTLMICWLRKRISEPVLLMVLHVICISASCGQMQHCNPFRENPEDSSRGKSSRWAKFQAVYMAVYVWKEKWPEV